ncbi:MAG: hypothetical protein HY303_00955 [Candidatus Wallbacteria bacterium]|nr:hypothetical protein [Candidatus Wallbacteria bacterium]
MRGYSRRWAFTLIETAMAVLILGASLATVLSMITTSFHQMGQQKMQTSAVGFAAGQMNRFLFEEPFATLASVPYTEVVLDGVWFQYKLDVKPVPNSAIHFKFKHIQYHDPRHGGATSTGAEPSVPTMTEENPPITQLDSKSTGGGAIPVLKDLLLTVRWHGPGDDYTDEFVLKLVSRKAHI